MAGGKRQTRGNGVSDVLCIGSLYSPTPFPGGKALKKVKIKVCVLLNEHCWQGPPRPWLQAIYRRVGCVCVQEESVRQLSVSRSQRTKRKSVTVVVGLKTFGEALSPPPPPPPPHTIPLSHHPPFTDIELKKASKSFAQHFSCGSSVTGEDEIVIQGDVYDDIIDFIQDKWPQVSNICSPLHWPLASAVCSASFHCVFIHAGDRGLRQVHWRPKEMIAPSVHLHHSLTFSIAEHSPASPCSVVLFMCVASFPGSFLHMHV